MANLKHGDSPSSSLLQLQRQVAQSAYWDEADCVRHLLSRTTLNEASRQRITTKAQQLITASRANKEQRDTLDILLEEFGLDTKEGVALMCLAESLLRIPDGDTADEFIHEKLLQGDWQKHLGHSPSLFVNASIWGLLLTGKWLQFEDAVKLQHHDWLHSLLERIGEPLVRRCLLQAMRIMGQHYILGTSIEGALTRSKKLYSPTTRFSFDALGEGARSQADADRHFASYQKLITHLKSSRAQPSNDIYSNHSISIKLSALHPRYQFVQKNRVLTELLPRVKQLCLLARDAYVGLSIDAEEAERLDLELQLFSLLALDQELRDWPGLGFVLQAYQKRAVIVADWLIALAQQRQTPLCVRLVKGAYWDREIKYAQQLGLPDYPVFTRKVNTDLSYMVCAEKLLRARKKNIYPQFATHNAMTIAMILELVDESHSYELQRLHGMGHLLYDQVSCQNKQSERPDIPVRVYAPIGGHRDLLPYLARRLLENGANSSFVNRFMDEQFTAQELSRDIISQVEQSEYRHLKIPLPANIYGQRKNSAGIDINNPISAKLITDKRDTNVAWPTLVSSIIDGQPRSNGEKIAATSPFNKQQILYHWLTSTPQDIEQAFTSATQQQSQWNAQGIEFRAQIIKKTADLLEQRKLDFMHLIVIEAGRTWLDAEAEVREAIDFCRYYTEQAISLLSAPTPLPGATGESNRLEIHGRGIFVCISPWNFPLAIFCGQVVAALVTGNCVIAKPAEQTPLVAYQFVQLLFASGLPTSALHVLLGTGEAIGKTILQQTQLDGVCFTGSEHTAKNIQRQLAQREGPLTRLIAETGGINAMLVDSSALLEQVVDDVVQSAFNSTGQRCSALRVLCIHEAIYEELIELLCGACKELTVGDPRDLNTDIGPVIDSEAHDRLNKYCQRTQKEFNLRYRHNCDALADQGYFIGPHIFEIDSFSQVKEEVFGPVLHVLKYSNKGLPKLLKQINASRFGLTLGVHSRIQGWAEKVIRQTNVGNNYVNRNMVGAVVGSQPFGGQGLSGTGPKAGGPHYLLQFTTEKTVTINTVATGGNAALFNLEE